MMNNRCFFLKNVFFTLSIEEIVVILHYKSFNYE